MSEKSTSLVAQGYIDYNDQTFFYRATKIDDEILLDVSVVMGAKTDEQEKIQFSFIKSQEEGKFYLDTEKTESKIDFAIEYDQQKLALIAKDMPLVGDLILTQNRNNEVVIKSCKNNVETELVVLDKENSITTDKNKTFNFKVNGILRDVEKKSNSFVAKLANTEINRLTQAAMTSLGVKNQVLSSDRNII